MPRTSGSCLHSSPDPGHREHGFTLLELLIVLALAALVTGLVAPVASRGLDAARERAAVRELSSVLESLPLSAFQAGADMALDAQALRARLSEWPDAWVIELAEPLQYTAAGVATGGVVQVRPSSQPAWSLRVQPVTGVVRLPAESAR